MLSVFFMASNYKNIANFIFEVGELKRIKRSGWWQLKIKEPESVAEHSFRTAIIAFLLAKLENHPNPERIAFSALAHDLAETRLLDLHKLSSSYIKNKSKLQSQISSEQAALLPFPLPKVTNNDDRILIKDADALEMAFSAKEYGEAGCGQARIFMKSARGSLKLTNSKKLYSQLNSSDSSEWWASLKEMKVD